MSSRSLIDSLTLNSEVAIIFFEDDSDFGMPSPIMVCGQIEMPLPVQQDSRHDQVLMTMKVVALINTLLKATRGVVLRFEEARDIKQRRLILFKHYVLNDGVSDNEVTAAELERLHTMHFRVSTVDPS